MKNGHAPRAERTPVHLPHSSLKETPVTDYPPYRPALSANSAQLLNRLSLCVHSVIHYRGRPTWSLHRSAIDERLFLVIAGRGRFVIAGREYSVEAGDCIHLRRGVPHSATTDPQAPIEFISLRYTATLFDSLLLGDVLPLPDHFRPETALPLRSLLEDACRAFVLRPSGWQQSLDALGLWLLLWLLREQTPPQSLRWQSERVAELQRLVPALQALHADLTRSLSVPAQARLCGFSQEQFRRVFRRVLGLSPGAYNRRMRLEKACYLLQHTNETIETIAARVGYTRLTSFAHTFKEQFGIAPGEYRRQSLADD